MEHISDLVLTYGYALVFALVFLDQAAVSIPSPPFVTAMGVLASNGRFNISLAFIVVFGSAFIADCVWFRIGRSATNKSFKPLRFLHWNEYFPNVVHSVRRGVIGAILSVKFSLLPSALVPLAAGLARLTTRRFLFMAGVGNLAWTSAYLIGGFTAGYPVMNVLSRTSVLIAATVVCCLVLILPTTLRWCFKRRQEKLSDEKNALPQEEVKQCIKESFARRDERP
jgi:membrane protein DedA with SNARE-associated domain